MFFYFFYLVEYMIAVIACSCFIRLTNRACFGLNDIANEKGIARLPWWFRWLWRTFELAECDKRLATTMCVWKYGSISNWGLLILSTSYHIRRSKTRFTQFCTNFAQFWISYFEFWTFLLGKYSGFLFTVRWAPTLYLFNCVTLHRLTVACQWLTVIFWLLLVAYIHDMGLLFLAPS